MTHLRSSLILVVTLGACGGNTAQSGATGNATTGGAPIVWAAPEQVGPQELRADLDGDGAVERAWVEGDLLHVGDATLAHAFPVEGVEGGTCSVELRVVDIDTADRQRELVASCTLPDDLPNELVTAFDGAALRALGKTTAELVTTGDGNATTVGGNCGETTTTIYHLEAGGLVQADQQTTGTYDEAQCCC